MRRAPLCGLVGREGGRRRRTVTLPPLRSLPFNLCSQQNDAHAPERRSNGGFCSILQLSPRSVGGREEKRKRARKNTSTEARGRRGRGSDEGGRAWKIKGEGLSKHGRLLSRGEERRREERSSAAALNLKTVRTTLRETQGREERRSDPKSSSHHSGGGGGAEEEEEQGWEPKKRFGRPSKLHPGKVPRDARCERRVASLALQPPER